MRNSPRCQDRDLAASKWRKKYLRNEISLSISREDDFSRSPDTRALSTALFLACRILRRRRQEIAKAAGEGSSKYVVIHAVGSYVGDSASFTSRLTIRRRRATRRVPRSHALARARASAHGKVRISQPVDLVSSTAHIRAMKANEGYSLVRSMEGSSDTGYVVRHESNIESEAAADDQEKVYKSIFPGTRPSFRPFVRSSVFFPVVLMIRSKASSSDGVEAAAVEPRNGSPIKSVSNSRVIVAI